MRTHCRTFNLSQRMGAGRQAVDRAVAATVRAGTDILERELRVASSKLVVLSKTVIAFEASWSSPTRHLGTLRPELHYLMDPCAGTSFAECSDALWCAMPAGTRCSVGGIRQCSGVSGQPRRGTGWLLGRRAIRSLTEMLLGRGGVPAERESRSREDRRLSI